MNEKNYYQYCAVPYCGNTSIKTPAKLFIHVPAKTDIRNKWLELARLNPKDVSAKSNLFFCEDHFDLPNDIQNYIEYHLLGAVKRILMKHMCLPSKFACHRDRKKRTTATPRDAFLKRQRKELIDQLLNDDQENELEEVSMNITHLAESSSTDKFSEQMVVASGVYQPDQVQEIPPDLPKSTNKSIQAYIAKKYRSKSSQTHIRKRNSVTSPIKVKKVNIAISPIKNIAPSKSGAIRKLTFKEEEGSEIEISITPSVPDSSQSWKSVKVTSDSSSNEEKIKAEEEFKKLLNLLKLKLKINHDI